MKEFFADYDGSQQFLEKRLSAACTGASVPGAAVALVNEAAGQCAAVGTDADGAAFDVTTALPLSCASRLFVAALVAALAQQGKLNIDDELSAHLGFSSEAHRTYFDGISIRHLLAQTDGIGYRHLEAAPLTSTGTIDVDALATLICADRRAFAPGRLYSTNHCAFGLIGAVVEKHMGKKLGKVLREDLLAYLSPGSSTVSDTICAVTGRGFQLSAADLTVFLRFQLRPNHFQIPAFQGMSDFSLLFECQAEYLGWSAGMTGACLAWKRYSGGWVGHNGNSSGRTVILRLHPERELALAFLCRAPLPMAYAAMSRLFGPLMDEFNPPDAPRLMSQEELDAVSLDRYVGTFGNDSRRICVSKNADGRLAIAVTERVGNAGKTLGAGVLVPASKGIFFIPPPNAFGVWFVQYVSDAGADRGVDMVWDGWHVWRRLEEGRAALA